MSSPKQQGLIYSEAEKDILLKIARLGLLTAVGHSTLDRHTILSRNLPPSLEVWRACFVTLQKAGELRGCTGTLMPRQSLAEEVFESTVQTAQRDPRFEPVSVEEAPDLAISISILTTPTSLKYESPTDLINKLRPGIDGVTLEYGFHRGTFLPQVWEKIDDPMDFLSRLCQKMGLPRTSWMSERMNVGVYQAVEVSEPGYQS